MDYVRATDIAVVTARVFTILFAIVGLAFGIWTLVLLAPFLWMMSSQEQRMARMRADDFADYHGGGQTPIRGFAVRQRDGRLVIEVLD
jgi:hypothetical protein